MPLPFTDRTQAGMELAAAVRALELHHVVISAIPRGGVMVAAPVAHEMGSKLWVVVTRKVGSPVFQEVAAGALTPDGEVLYNRQVMSLLDINPGDLEEIVAAEREELELRISRYEGHVVSGEVIEGKSVVLVDDGIATGFTVRAALSYLRRLRARRLVLAVPVAAVEAVAELRSQVEELICLAAPVNFTSVGAYYQSFPQVSHYEVLEHLEQ